MLHSNSDSQLPPCQPPAGKAQFGQQQRNLKTWKGSIVSFPRVNFCGDLRYLKMKGGKERQAKTKQLKPPPLVVVCQRGHRRQRARPRPPTSVAPAWTI